MNWGIKIIILYSGFVVMILGFVIAASMQDFHMVTEDYYAAEQRYEQQVERIRNTRQLAEQPEVQYQDGYVDIRFPEHVSADRGQLLLYRPSDAGLDRRETLALADGHQRIQTGKLARGLWRAQLSWEQGGKGYFMEKVLVIEP
ncbi:MAG: hypothetical protein D6722_20970 [Bacteroidetes bacterium]|nr:MAG: hypothetical protein D6722_20970 [Bacteroidota bacterium]